MTIEQLPSGSYRIRKSYQGKRYTIVCPYKPSQKEAIQLMAERLDGIPGKHSKMTFAVASKEYVEMKRNVLSPRTIREYLLYPNRLPQWFVEMNLSDIGQEEVQRCINELSQSKAPKTVYSLNGFISAILGQFNPHLKLYTTLPQKRKIEPNIPIDEEVKTILEYTKENAPMFYVALILACYSCRRSEICALQYPEDLDADRCVVHINKALVEDEFGKWVVKTTKTTDSTRDLVIPQEVVDIIQSQEYFYNGSPQSISNYLRRTQDKLGMTHFSVHKLRHYFASKLMDMGIDQKTIQELGGWKGNETLSKIYQHSLKAKDEERRNNIANALGKAII